MTKNMLSCTFRKIDVDQYNEDTFRVEESGASADSAGLASSCLASTNLPAAAPPDDAQLDQLVRQCKWVEALTLILKNAPFSFKPSLQKEKRCKMGLKILLSVKSATEIEETVNGLLREQESDKSCDDLLDSLMKLIYKGFESPAEGSSAQLLLWHEKTFAVAGLGSIIRVLTGNRRL